jgi:excisionase family DNA binding protein
MDATMLEQARAAVVKLRECGDEVAAAAVEAVIAAAVEADRDTPNFLTSTEAGRLVGVTGQTIKNWVQSGRITGYRIGSRIMIPAEAVEAYVALARSSLDLPEVSDEEAAALVEEARGRRSALAQ